MQPDEKNIVKQKQETAQRNRSTGDAGVKGRETMTPDKCRELCESIGKEYLPGYESRVLRYVITSEAKDRYGDIVRASGARLDNYKKNPVVLYCHENQNLPVGTALMLKTDKVSKQISAIAMFLDSRVDTSGRSDLVYKFASTGFLPGCSIGFMPIKTNRPGSKEERDAIGLGEFGVEFLEWELLEFSPCAVPANPDALVASFKSIDISKSEITKQDLLDAERAAIFDAEWLSVVESVLLGQKTIIGAGPTKNDNGDVDAMIEADMDLAPYLKPYPNEHACRLRQPSEFEEFRRGTRKHEGKTYSVIYGKEKEKESWAEQAYRYSVDDWTKAEANAHCKDSGGMTFEPASGKSNILEFPQIKATVDVTPMTEAMEKINVTVKVLSGSVDSIMKSLSDLTQRIESASHDVRQAVDDVKGEKQKKLYDIFNDKPNI